MPATPDIADAVDGAAEGLERDGRLLGHGDVRGSGADDRNPARQGRQRLADDGDAAGDGMKTSVRELRDDGLEVLGSGAGAEHDAIRLDEGAGDGEHLLRQLPGAEDHLREAAAGAPVGIHAGKT